MTQEVVSHCCLSVFFSAFCSEGLRSARSSGLHGYCVWRACRLGRCSLALSKCTANAVRTPSIRSFDAPTLALVSIPTVCFPTKKMYCRRGYKRNDKYAMIERKVSSQHRTASHHETRITRLSLITLSRCCYSGCNLPATTFPSPLVFAREYPIQVKRRRD